ncbi:ubiquitin-conjugating enzyme E2-23 kDa [Artemisia annua]|uniref:Ubiquitin-conjugating enzyme E2-23 kDa n=1 Tax=Artemisia annua TaxID=35608 RepID=A0A2U1NLM1_ARTAN|nr:ubiquitin-conjugating enzyme E2-23 kDa [Artemisia annua]
MASQNTRKATDLRKLIKNGYKVEMINDNVDEFHVFLNGPPDSLYSEGVWKVAVKLPEDYPSTPPSIEFRTTIYHPNIQMKIKNGYKVEMINDNVDEFHVFLNGPPDSLYSEGVWKVAVKLPEDYPSTPPSIEFRTTIYHPNIQMNVSGSMTHGISDSEFRKVSDAIQYRIQDSKEKQVKILVTS